MEIGFWPSTMTRKCFPLKKSRRRSRKISSRKRIKQIVRIACLSFKYLLAEIILLDGLICVYRSNVDLFFYVIGSAQENELILVNVLNCLYDSVSVVLRKNVEKKALLDNIDIALLILDEICDDG